MSKEVSPSHQVFYEESFEGLNAIEMGLIAMQQGEPDTETITTIFRAAQLINTGAASFGFSQLSEFTDGLENLLEQMRNSEHEVSSRDVKVMLQAVGLLREMLTGLQQGGSLKQTAVADLSGQTEALPSTAVSEPDFQQAQISAVAGWQIDFKPHLHLLQTGNDPLLIIAELGELGDLIVSLDDKALPVFSELAPQDSYLGWSMTLLGDVSLDAVNRIFDPLEGDCDLVISPLEAETEAIAGASTAPLSLLQALASATEPKPPRAASADRPVLEPAMALLSVGSDKVDLLSKLVGELVATQSMLSQLGEEFDPSHLPQLIDGLEQLERHTRGLQEGIMRLRMLPISFSFNRFPQLVHELSAKMGKQVELKLTGEQTELDKAVLEKIADPLVYLVCYSLNHSLETPEQRRAAGKPETGLLHLNAHYQGGSIVIEISDDGSGLNPDKILHQALEKGLVDDTEAMPADKVHELIFMPGIATTGTVSDGTSPGLGMDVLRQNINSLGGSISVSSGTGKGSTFTIRLPMIPAIMEGQTIQVANERYILPLNAITESVEIKPGMVKNVAGKGEIFCLRDEYIPLIRLHELFNLKPLSDKLEQGLLVLVECDGDKAGLFVDQLLARQQVETKSLETHYRKVPGIAGATTLSDRSVVLILDIAGLLALYRDPQSSQTTDATRAA